MISFSFSNISGKESIYDITINDINGDIINLKEFSKYLLFVNVASECGFTPQYKGLEQLHQKYKDCLVVIGLPCNQFGGQESGSKDKIQQFCSQNYGASFLLTDKILVKGDEKHKLYSWLTDKSLNGTSNSSVRWNFQKYLVGPNGDLVDYFYSTIKPMNQKITSILRQ